MQMLSTLTVIKQFRRVSTAEELSEDFEGIAEVVVMKRRSTSSKERVVPFTATRE